MWGPFSIADLILCGDRFEAKVGIRTSSLLFLT